MIGADPANSPARPDLTFLRRRRLPAAARQPRDVPVGPGAAGVEPRDTAPPTDNLLDLSGAAGSLSGPAGSRPAQAPSGTSHAPTPGSRTAYQPRRGTSAAPVVLSPKHPAVTLTRLQSGIGVLTVEAACSSAVGDLRLGAAYLLADRQTSLVQYVTGHTTAPPGSQRPVIVAGHAGYERILVDLRQVGSLDRLLVYGFSQSGVPLSWGGTLLVTSSTGLRVELPLDRPAAGGVLVLASVYQAAGELTIRAEMELFGGSVRDAVTAYGFDRISWLDPATPLS